MVWPRTYAAARTPSGGTHELVAALSVASFNGVHPGLDVKAGLPDKAGRGFVFLAPTVKLSKTTGELGAYVWTQRPDLDQWAEERDTDDSGHAVAESIPRGPCQYS